MVQGLLVIRPDACVSVFAKHVISTVEFTCYILVHHPSPEHTGDFSVKCVRPENFLLPLLHNKMQILDQVHIPCEQLMYENSYEDSSVHARHVMLFVWKTISGCVYLKIGALWVLYIHW